MSFHEGEPIHACIRGDTLCVEGTECYRTDQAGYFPELYRPDVLCVQTATLLLREPQPWYSPPIRVELLVGSAGRVYTAREFFTDPMSWTLETREKEKIGSCERHGWRVYNVPVAWGLRLEVVRWQDLT